MLHISCLYFLNLRFNSEYKKTSGKVKNIRIWYLTCICTSVWRHVLPLGFPNTTLLHESVYLINIVSIIGKESKIFVQETKTYYIFVLLLLRKYVQDLNQEVMFYLCLLYLYFIYALLFRGKRLQGGSSRFSRK